MDSIADSGTGGEAPTPITGASTEREDEDAGMGLLAHGRRRREPQTITRPVPVLIRPAQPATSGTLTRPWVRSSSGGRDGEFHAVVGDRRAVDPQRADRDSLPLLAGDILITYTKRRLSVLNGSEGNCRAEDIDR